MRPVLYVLSFITLLGLGFWAYRENYATQASLRQVAVLQDEIAGLRDALSTQNAEWAYLNRPERLRELATLNFDRLGLLPMEPAQFGTTSAIAFPPPPVAADFSEGGLPITDPVAISGAIDAAMEQTP